ncbi:MAG: putative metallopeptidase [Myxococcota bacterium]
MNEDNSIGPAPDWLSALEDAVGRAPNIESAFGSAAGGIDRMAKALKPLPPWLRERDLQHAKRLSPAYLTDAALPDTHAMIELLLNTCEERDYLHGCGVHIVWWTGKKASNDRIVLGKAGPIAARERLTWPGNGKAPMFRVQLSLAYWLLADDMARYRLLHHELGHCGIEETEEGKLKPIALSHDVEEFADTVMRFGVAGPEQAKLAAAINGHPTSKARARAWGIDLTGQQLKLFPWNKPEPSHAGAGPH